MYQSTISASSIISEFKNYMQKCGGAYSDWYVGVAANARDRLFNDHNVDEKNGQWIYEDCGSDSAARQVEKHFLNLGCQGGTGGGDHTTKFAYAYKIKGYTIE